MVNNLNWFPQTTRWPSVHVKNALRTCQYNNTSISELRKSKF